MVLEARFPACPSGLVCLFLSCLFVSLSRFAFLLEAFKVCNEFFCFLSVKG